MNIRHMVLCTLSSVLVLSIACPTRPGIRVTVPEWPEAEKNHYLVTLGGDSAGYYTSTLAKGMVVDSDTPLLELTALTELHVEEMQSRDSIWLLVRADNLRPLEAARHVTRPDGSGGSRTLYQDGIAKIEATSPLGSRRADLEAGPGVSDNDLLTVLLRALDIKVNDEYQLKLVVAMAATVVDVTVRRFADETITVPAGTFETRKFEVALAGQTLAVWYENSGARRMLRYEAPGAGMTMELLPETAMPVEQP